MSKMFWKLWPGILALAFVLGLFAIVTNAQNNAKTLPPRLTHPEALYADPANNVRTINCGDNITLASFVSYPDGQSSYRLRFSAEHAGYVNFYWDGGGQALQIPANNPTQYYEADITVTYPNNQPLNVWVQASSDPKLCSSEPLRIWDMVLERMP